MDERLKEIVERTEQLQGKAQELVEKLESAPTEEVEGMKAQLKEVGESIAELQTERADRLAEIEREDMKAQVTTLTGALEELRAPAPDGFKVAGEGSETDESVYGEGKAHSFYQDVGDARRGDNKAMERLIEAGAGVEDAKAMTEGTGSAGGFLVPPQISSDLIALRQQYSVLRPLFSSVPVTSSQLQIAAVTGGLTAGWVAELATKPSADLTFGQVITNVFTAAGLAVVSNQLLADSKFAVDSLVNADLARRLATLEEVAFLNGTGTGQPTGILGTSGVSTVTVTPTDVPTLLDAITDAITSIYTNWFGAPDAIVMHPRTWARIVKAREASAPSTYLIGSGSTAFGRRGNDPLPGYTNAQTPRGELFGVPVYTTANVPTNLGAGTNESRVIVGNFAEGLILDRQGITVDQSPHVYFTTNQTIFRSEERLGFTAARYPKAFCVVGGAGLAAG